MYPHCKGFCNILHVHRLLRHEDCEDGMFMVRDGSNAKCEYVLSVKFKQEVYHVHIYKDKVR